MKYAIRITRKNKRKSYHKYATGENGLIIYETGDEAMVWLLRLAMLDLAALNSNRKDKFIPNICSPNGCIIERFTNNNCENCETFMVYNVVPVDDIKEDEVIKYKRLTPEMKADLISEIMEENIENIAAIIRWKVDKVKSLSCAEELEANIAKFIDKLEQNNNKELIELYSYWF